MSYSTEDISCNTVNHDHLLDLSFIFFTRTWCLEQAAAPCRSLLCCSTQTHSTNVYTVQTYCILEHRHKWNTTGGFKNKCDKMKTNEQMRLVEVHQPLQKCGPAENFLGVGQNPFTLLNHFRPNSFTLSLFPLNLSTYLVLPFPGGRSQVRPCQCL